MYPLLVTETLLDEITARLVDAFDPEKVILFGSQAAGATRRDSDVDLLVIMEAEGSPMERAVAVKRACRPRFVAMDVLVKTPDEMALQLREGNLFLRQILDEGTVLYERHA